MLNANFTNVFFGNMIIKCTIWQLNASAAAFKQLSPGLCRQTLQTKRDNVTKEVNEFKSDYGRYMATMSKKVTEGKAEHARLTEYVSVKSNSLP